MDGLQIIQHNNQRVLTTSQIAEFYETENIKIQQNYSNNKQRYLPGIHFYLLEGEELREFKDCLENFEVVNLRTPSLYLWTERGALLHAKSLGTDKAWETYERLVETYFRAKDAAANLNSLSPLLQVLINMELKQAELENQLALTEQKVNGVATTLTLVKDTIIQRDDDWRNGVKKMFNSAVAASGTSDFQSLRQETYDILEERAHCNLGTRLGNLRDRLRHDGATKSKIAATSKLDVIENDPRLKEIYTSIVKELSIRYAS